VSGIQDSWKKKFEEFTTSGIIRKVQGCEDSEIATHQKLAGLMKKKKKGMKQQ